MIEAFKRWRRARHRKMLRARSARYKAVWRAKADDQIIHSYKDAMSWLMFEDPTVMHRPYKLPKGLSSGCRQRLNKYILPEMKRRGIDENQFTESDLTEYILNA